MTSPAAKFKPRARVKPNVRTTNLTECGHANCNKPVVNTEGWNLCEWHRSWMSGGKREHAPHPSDMVGRDENGNVIERGGTLTRPWGKV